MNAGQQQIKQQVDLPNSLADAVLEVGDISQAMNKAYKNLFHHAKGLETQVKKLTEGNENLTKTVETLNQQLKDKQDMIDYQSQVLEKQAEKLKGKKKKARKSS